MGLLKREWLDRELHPAAMRASHAIKAALDPVGILNPWKVLPIAGAGRPESATGFGRAGCDLSPQCLIRDVKIRMILVKMAPELGNQLLVIRGRDLMPALAGDAS